MILGQQRLPQCEQDRGADETTYREEVRDLTVWYQDNLSLNVSKTEELMVDYRIQRSEHAPIHIKWPVVDQVESFKFLSVHITKDLTWSTHTDKVVKRAQQCLFPLRRLKRFAKSSKRSTAAPLRAP